jgi:hypothetical protein
MSELNVREALDTPLGVSILAGVGGSMFAAARLIPGNNIGEKLANLVVGSVVATFCAPGVIEYFEIKTLGLAGLMGFFIGTFGLSLMAAIFAGMREVKFGEIISGWLSRRD